MRSSGFAVALLVLTSVSASPSTTRWAWFRSSSTPDGWFITQGTADVTIDGRNFSATLWDAADSSWARLSLVGSIVDNAVTVTVTVNNSDVEPWSVSGRLERQCWKRGGGREAIVLSAGFGVIGLVRELPGEVPCPSGA